MKSLKITSQDTWEECKNHSYKPAKHSVNSQRVSAPCPGVQWSLGLCGDRFVPQVYQLHLSADNPAGGRAGSQ